MCKTVLVLVLLTVATFFVSGVAQATYPGDNGKILYIPYYEGTGYLYKMNPDGTSPQYLDHAQVVGLPKWSPDGMKIAYVSYDGDTEISVMDANGGNKTRLTSNSTEDQDPTWSPDGTKIAFRKDFDRIWVMDTDGTGSTNLYDTERACCEDGSP